MRHFVRMITMMALLALAAVLAVRLTALASGKGREASADRDLDWSSSVAYANYAEYDALVGACRNGETLGASDARHVPVFVCRTSDDLDSLRKTLEGKLEFSKGLDEMPSFDSAVSGYSRQFWRHHGLVIAYVMAGSGSFRYGAESVTLRNGNLCVGVEQLNHPEVYDTSMAGWWIIVEAERDVLESCTSFDAVIAD